jgi:aryl-alcohol dehydrogenase-like predicted oxidoreductase
MEKRAYGRSGEKLSVVGFGGIIVMNEEPDAAARFVSEAIDRDVNYFDVAPSYGDAEVKLGPALEPYRNRVFLACKTGMRTAKEAMAELERSLVRLRTDHFDLYQHHAVTTREDVEKILGPDGAMETFVKARQKGMVRHLGFSAHSEEAALALMDGFDFDSILFPFNWACWLKGGFGKAVLDRAREKGVTRLALKTLAKRKWLEGEEKSWPKCWYKPVDTYEEAEKAVRFTLSMPVTAGVSPSHVELFRWMCDAVEKLGTITPPDEEALKAAAAELDVIFGGAA